MKMRGKTNSIRLGLEILTPVQCGSGQEMFRELDYVEKEKQVFVVDQPQSFNTIASSDTQLDTLLTGSSKLSDLVILAGEHFGYALPVLSGSNHKVPDRFKAHLKDAMFRPYIAGSAIKGAIRTALIADFIRNLLQANDQPQILLKGKLPNKPVNPKFAFQILQKELIGKEPNQDIFRALHVKDAIFTAKELCLADIRWLNLTGLPSKEIASWRNMSNKKNLVKWQEASGVYAEMLKPHSLTSFELQWDDFLLSNTKAWNANQTAVNILPINFEGLKAKLNQHALYRLENEIAFYKKYGVLATQKECELLQQKIAQDDSNAYLQLSWGSGWRGMTGDWLPVELAAEMRTLFKLGKPNMPFPKTRRLAVSGEPKLPLGWVCLVQYQQVEEKINQQQAAKIAKDNRCAWVDSQISQLMKKNKCQANDALRGGGLAQAWQNLEESDLKQQALEDIKNRWQKENWWDEPNGRAAKQAKAIYQANTQ